MAKIGTKSIQKSPWDRIDQLGRDTRHYDTNKKGADLLPRKGYMRTNIGHALTVCHRRNDDGAIGLKEKRKAMAVVNRIPSREAAKIMELFINSMSGKFKPAVAHICTECALSNKTQYYRGRERLVKLGYINIDDQAGIIYVEFDKLLEDYKTIAKVTVEHGKDKKSDEQPETKTEGKGVQAVISETAVNSNPVPSGNEDVCISTPPEIARPEERIIQVEKPAAIAECVIDRDTCTEQNCYRCKKYSEVKSWVERYFPKAKFTALDVCHEMPVPPCKKEYGKIELDRMLYAVCNYVRRRIEDIISDSEEDKERNIRFYLSTRVCMLCEYREWVCRWNSTHSAQRKVEYNDLCHAMDPIPCTHDYTREELEEKLPIARFRLDLEYINSQYPEEKEDVPMLPTTDEEDLSEDDDFEW